MKIIDAATAKRLVIARMDSETSKLLYARTIQEQIAFEESIHLPRWVRPLWESPAMNQTMI